MNIEESISVDEVNGTIEHVGIDSLQVMLEGHSQSEHGDIQNK